MAERQLSAGIVGLGHLHPRLYMPLFQYVPEMRVSAVCDENAELRNAFAKEYALHDYADLGEMLEKETLDAALVFLPHSDCPEAAVACAEAGLHLMVEKPVAADAAGCRRIVEAASAAGVQLTTAYLWRYHPVARHMRRLITEGALGTPVGCEGRCAAGRVDRYIDGNAAWMLQREKSGGGPMYNLGVHWIDLYRWLLDDEVAEVIGKNATVGQDYDIEDNSFAILTFCRGAVVSLDISYTVPDSYPYSRDLHLSLRGTGGALSWDPSFEGINERLFLCSDQGEYAGSPRRHVDFELEKREGYCGIMGVQFLRDFARAVFQEGEVLITGDDAVAALEVVEAIYTSAQTGKAVALA